MVLLDAFQKRIEKQNPKSSSEKFNHEEDGGSGFPIEPSRGGSLRYNGRLKQLEKLNEPQSGVGDSSRHYNYRGLNEPQSGVGDSPRHYNYHGAQLSKFSNSLAWHDSSRLDHNKGTSAHWPEDWPNGKYHQLNDTESSHHMLDGPNCSNKKLDHAPGKGYAPKKTRIHYSGPLVPPGGNMDEMLKEHERQIQHAVRKARLDKTKTKKGYADNGQRESLLQYGENFR